MINDIHWKFINYLNLTVDYIIITSSINRSNLQYILINKQLYNFNHIDRIKFTQV